MKIKRNGLIVVVGLLLCFFAGCKSHPKHLDRLELFRNPGVQWLSWNATERENFVYGFLMGYDRGAHEACLAADDLFEKDKPHLYGLPNTFPSVRCNAAVKWYSSGKIDMSSGPDFSPYTNVITEFYTKHPDRVDIQITQLLDYLVDPKNLNVDELYSNFTGFKSPTPPR